MFDSPLAQDPTTRELQGTDRPNEASADEMQQHRHLVLMDLLDYEGDRQSEERLQMQIDEDYYDHLQWRPEDAQELIDRGQAPVVFNEARTSIDWIAGTEKRMRKSYKILPREKGDEQGAELKTKLVKYTDDVNLTPWHRSKAFKQAATAGLSWLEEGANPDPEAEIIYSGSEDWRNVYRDSHSRNIDINVDGRYLFRRKVIDLDYAAALLPAHRAHLQAVAGRFEEVDMEGELWYLGQRLTGASDTEWGVGGTSATYGPRGAYVRSNGYADYSRRRSVELLECWYKVPERVKVFAAGRGIQGKVVDPTNQLHAKAIAERVSTYEAVKMRMRVMIATRQAPLLDLNSPFRHNRFLLVPIFAYRRARDGLAYGPMRGMRDIQDDLNKRRSKALFALSNNRIVMDDDAVEDIEDTRLEAARPDGIITKKKGADLRFEQHAADYQANVDLAMQDAEIMRNVGGVTNENLGRDTNAQSGKAIIAKQDQGSLTTGEIFDNFLLAIQQAGRLRLSHIEQLWTEEKAVRIVGEAKPIEWIEVNKFDPATGQIMNDITAREADFIVDTQDYRASLAQAALESMFALLTSIATFAPEMVMAVLDLVVESADLPNKEEWVTRIRKLNGQRDPTKPPTPEELKAEKVAQAKQAEAEQLMTDTAKATLAELNAKIDKLRADTEKADSQTVLSRMDTLMKALQSAQEALLAPAITPAADELAKSAGFEDQTPGSAPRIPAMAARVLEQQPAQPEPGIEAPQGAMPAPEAPPAGAGIPV